MNAVSTLDSHIAEAEFRLRRAHIRLMKDQHTYLYSGVLLLGKTTVDDTTPTACTNGLDVFYGARFLSALSDVEVAGLVLHENLHKFLKQIHRHKDLMEKHAGIANAAMDYVVNDIIMGLEKATGWLRLPSGGLYDAKFANWSTRQIFEFLYKAAEQEGDGDPDKGIKNGSVSTGDGSYKVETLDEHDGQAASEMSDEQIEEIAQKIDDAIQQSALLAGLTGAKLPRAITELLQPEIDWATALKEFMQTNAKGSDEHTYRKFNRRRIVDDLYRPGTYTERAGRVLVAIDTSGSISQQQLASFAGELASICAACRPEEVQVLWWDTQVHGVQTFTESSYGNITSMLKPAGFGGTCVGCVSEYITSQRIEADCLVVFTDGYVEAQPTWKATVPALWVVTSNESFTPPAGVRVNFK